MTVNFAGKVNIEILYENSNSVSKIFKTLKATFRFEYPVTPSQPGN